MCTITAADVYHQISGQISLKPTQDTSVAAVNQHNKPTSWWPVKLLLSADTVPTVISIHHLLAGILKHVQPWQRTLGHMHHRNDLQTEGERAVRSCRQTPGNPRHNDDNHLCTGRAESQSSRNPCALQRHSDDCYIAAVCTDYSITPKLH